jgi:hypothetical protein
MYDLIDGEKICMKIVNESFLLKSVDDSRDYAISFVAFFLQ